MNNDEYKVTPWEVSGEVNYIRLIKEFGVSPLTEELVSKFKKLFGVVPFELKRKLFYAHRDFDKMLKIIESGDKIYLYTGRGPSGPMHIGHLFPFIFTKKLQDILNTLLIIQVTSDEKFLYHQSMDRNSIYKYTYDNIRDILALGFKPDKTIVIDDLTGIHYLYQIAVSVAKRVTFSTARSVFGFTHDTNIGMIFFMSIQAAPAFIGYYLNDKYKGCLIPAAIDQDPYWRVARDIASRIKLPKPAQIHGKLIPGLRRGVKMSASMPETAIYLTDSPKDVKNKIWNAFTGGQPTVELQRKYGGDPDRCVVFSYYKFLFESSEDELRKRYDKCKQGELTCGECKLELIERINKFLEEHARKKSKISDEDVKIYLINEKVDYKELSYMYRSLR